MPKVKSEIERDTQLKKLVTRMLTDASENIKISRKDKAAIVDDILEDLEEPILMLVGNAVDRELSAFVDESDEEEEEEEEEDDD